MLAAVNKPARSALGPVVAAGESSLRTSANTITNARLHRRFSVLNRPPPNYPGHVPLTPLERAGLAFGSAFAALRNPRRADLIAALGEATATPYFITRLRDVMLRDATGRQILRERPRITSTTLSLPYLRSLPENTLGATYMRWLEREKVSPDTRAAVRYIDDEECAYVMQRYRECHDFYHAVVGMPTMREGEVALKAFEFVNTRIPMTALSCVAVTTLNEAERKRFWDVYLPWAVRGGMRCKDLINVYWEKQLERDIGELREELCLEVPPDLREIRRRLYRERKAKEQAQTQSQAQAAMEGQQKA